MMGLDLTGKNVFDLKPEDFEKLFCHRCRYYPDGCRRRLGDISACKQLIDDGKWDGSYRRKATKTNKKKEVKNGTSETTD